MSRGLAWNILRATLAGALLWFVAADTGGRLARLRLASAPDFDFPAEVRSLREAGRYGEALMVADRGEAVLGPRAEAGDARARTLLEELRRQSEQTRNEQSSLLRRVRDLGMGALSGRGTSLESLLGAVATDFFVVGDVRDIVIQGGKLLVDGDADELILLLSGAGLATTIAPHVDWSLSVLKVARKSGTMTRRMGRWMTDALKAGKADEVAKVAEDVATLSKRASPGGAARLMRLADEPADVTRMARFAERQAAGSGGAFALHALGDQATDTLRLAENTADAAKAEIAVVKAAEKGTAGAAWLRSGAWRAAMSPHPIIGLLKGFYKGTIPDLVQRAIDALGGAAWWLIPLLAAWLFVELALLARRFSGRSTGAAPARTGPSPA
ncbi:MAG: hypothetical protein KIT68_02220 [Phycisphaeraceae bacterium]|nr:hypothetical protein [Phycisphaeraceae bacterium]